MAEFNLEIQGQTCPWKKRFLTKAGRLVHIKSTLIALPVFLLSALVLPVSVEDELERIMRNFLWGSTTEVKKFYLLSWDIIFLPLHYGGLGINRLHEVNISLLC